MADIQELGVTLKATDDNPDVGDLELSATGDLVWRTDLATSVAQRLTVRLAFFKGEWALNLDEGTPWFQYILGVKAPKDAAIRAVLGRVIRGTEGVSELLSLTYTIDRNRHMQIAFKAQLVDGTVFRSVDYPPFVVTI